jgi:hypothetical protein
MPKFVQPCFILSAYVAINASILINTLLSDSDSCGVCRPDLLLTTCYICDSIKQCNLIRDGSHMTKWSNVYWCAVMKSVNLGIINHNWCMTQGSDISVLNSLLAI